MHLGVVIPHKMRHYAPREYLRLLEPIGIFTEDTTKHLSFSSEAKNSIERFLEIIKTGEMTYQYDKSAIKLRDFLLTSHLGGNAAREDAFKKVQYALDNYLNKKPINRLLPIASGIFNS